MIVIRSLFYRNSLVRAPVLAEWTQPMPASLTANARNDPSIREWR
jgi:hypothetical protein